MGKITEIAGGKITEVSSQDIENNAGSFIDNIASGLVRQKGTANGVTYDKASSNERKLKNTIKGFAVFRRKSNYGARPDFGFDWYGGENYGTTYTEPYHFDDDKTVLSGRNKLRREYSSVTKYIPVREFGYIEAGKNGQGPISINDKTYFVPWFAGFAKDNSGAAKSYEIDVFFNIEEPAEGNIKIHSENESIEVEFTDDGSSMFDISESYPKQFTKTLKITFQDYITEDTTLVVTFHKKSDEEKAEEKKEQEDAAAGKTPQTMRSIYVSAGELMGILNVYQNSVEYDVVFRYVKVFFKGWIYLDGFKDKVYLSGARLSYQEDEDLLNRQKNLTNGIANLQTLQASITSDPARLQEIQDLLRKQQRELLDIQNLTAQRTAISRQLFNEQHSVMQSKTTFIANNRPSLTNMFAQPLIRYKELNTPNYEQLEIDVKEMDSFFTDLKLKNSHGSHSIITDDNKEINSDRIRDKISKAFKSRETADKKELMVFLLPFGIISSVKNNLILLGQAEDVSYEADSAMLTPQADASTFIHEAGHTFNLSHTFLKRGGGWFSEGIKIAQGTTDNIMDYSYNLQNKDSDPSNDVNIIEDKIALWKFQWDIMRKDPNLVESVKK